MEGASVTSAGEAVGGGERASGLVETETPPFSALPLATTLPESVLDRLPLCLNAFSSSNGTAKELNYVSLSRDAFKNNSLLRNRMSLEVLAGPDP